MLLVDPFVGLYSQDLDFEFSSSQGVVCLARWAKSGKDIFPKEKTFESSEKFITFKTIEFFESEL